MDTYDEIFIAFIDLPFAENTPESKEERYNNTPFHCTLNRVMSKTSVAFGGIGPLPAAP